MTASGKLRPCTSCTVAQCAHIYGQDIYDVSTLTNLRVRAIAPHGMYESNLLFFHLAHWVCNKYKLHYYIVYKIEPKRQWNQESLFMGSVR